MIIERMNDQMLVITNVSSPRVSLYEVDRRGANGVNRQGDHIEWIECDRYSLAFGTGQSRLVLAINVIRYDGIIPLLKIIPCPSSDERLVGGTITLPRLDVGFLSNPI